MRKQIKSHPDNKVYVINGTKVYIDTIDNFNADVQTLDKPNPTHERSGYWQYTMASTGNDTSFCTISPDGMHGVNSQDDIWINAENIINSIDALINMFNERELIKSNSVQ